MNLKIVTPASHRDDPETSYIAEANMNASGKRFNNQEVAFLHVKVFPGKTAAELGELSGLGQHELSRRLADLDGIKVRKGARKKCSVKGSTMVSWWPILPDE
jgi:hypothetical protein